MAKQRDNLGLTLSKKNEKEQAQKAAKQKPAKNSTSIVAKIVGYLKGVVQELKRVTWPTPKEMLNSGVIVIMTLIFFALFTFAWDSLATKGVTALASTTSKEATATPQATTTITPSTSVTTTGTGQ